MPIINGYCTLSDLKDWVKLNDSIDDLKLERSITAASRGIDNFCDRQFWQFIGARVFDTCDEYLLDIDDLTSISSVKTDDNADGTFETVWAASDHQLLPLNPAAEPEPGPFNKLKAIANRTFPRPSGRASRLGLVEITGTWGWPAIPESVYQACLLVTARLVKRKESPEGVSGFDDFGVIRISSRDDPDAVRLLDPYWNAASVGV